MNDLRPNGHRSRRSRLSGTVPLLMGALLVGLSPSAAGANSRVQPQSAATPEFDSVDAAAMWRSTVYVAGTTAGSLDGANEGGRDVFVRRYRGSGELLWADQFGSHVNDFAAGIAVDERGNAYVVGTTSGSIAGSRGGFDGFIRKYDAAGNVKWTRQFGTDAHDLVRAVAVGPQGILVVGSMGGDQFIRNYGPGGVVRWTRKFGTPGETFEGVAADANGNGFVVGATAGSGFEEFDAFIRKYNAGGNVLWTRQFGTADNDRARAVATDGTGAAIVVGSTLGDLEGSNAGDFDAFVRKYSSSGAVVATDQFGTAVGDVATAVTVDRRDRYYVAGRTQGDLAATNPGDTDAFVRKYASHDGVVWTTQFGTDARDEARAVSALRRNAIYVGGLTGGSLVGTNAGGLDGFLRRLDGNGNHVWTDQ